MNYMSRGYQVNFGQAIKSGFKNYVNFRGAATRSEYWYWFLFTTIVSTLLGMVDTAIGSLLHIGGDVASGQSQFTLLGNIWSFATLLPSLGLFVRRLRDAGYSIKRLWLYAIPFGLGLAALVSALPALASQIGRFETGNVDWAPFVLAGLFLLLSAVAATVVGILFIVWLCQPSKVQVVAGSPEGGALPDFINPPGHPDTNTQY
jgi:uncharacterized membrane protein YhaH (DUF805 family)